MLRDMVHISNITYFLFDVTVFGIFILNVPYAVCVQPVTVSNKVSFYSVLLCSVIIRDDGPHGSHLDFK